MPGTSWSFHFWQPAPRWRLHRRLAKPDNPGMSPHAPEKTGTCQKDQQRKVAERRMGGGKSLNGPNKVLLLPATPINKLYCTTLRTRNLDSRASITKCDNNSPQSLLVVKFHLTSKQKVFSFLMSCKTELGMLCAFHVTLTLALQYC